MTESKDLANNVEILKEIFKENPALLNEFLSNVKNSEDKRGKLSDLLKSNVNPSVIKVSQDTYSLQIETTQDCILKLFQTISRKCQIFCK